MARRHGLGRGLSALIPEGPQEEADEVHAEDHEMETPGRNGTAKERTKRSGTEGHSNHAGKSTEGETAQKAAAPDGSAEKGDSLQTIRIARIEPDPSQPRKYFSEEELEELASSIKEHGLLQPIVVTPQKRAGRYTIVAGERRWRACQKAGLKEIQAIVRIFDNPQQQLEASLIENIQREDLNPIEEAQAYQRLIEDFGLTQEETAQKVSRSRTAVTNSLRLLKLSPEVQELVISGSLSMGHARALLAVEDRKLQKELADRIARDGLSVRDTEKLVKNLGKPKNVSRETDPSLAAVYNDIQNRMQQSLGMNVRIFYKNNKSGKVEISFTDNDDLEKLMGRIFV